ncbi:MAG: hypothetical protein LBQ98_04785 [Nitrososphaerota archaeon]|jgi:bifunctional DNA-binding transcriptional regulator/antitoxin component of YhaV-PrlF toxin-antitoxin module|nr:hypothetical protein [Nitrososphaerota archaeon]
MTEATYHENKLYLPKKVRETLRLVDGDVLHIEVVEKGTAKLYVVRRNNATKSILEKLDNPPDMGKINGKLSRDEIYEDIT